MSEGNAAAGEALPLLEQLIGGSADRACIDAAVQLGLKCHARMLEEVRADQHSAILDALTGARLLAAVQQVDSTQPAWVKVHEEQCCSCAGRWIHELALADAEFPNEWFSAAAIMLDRLESINPVAASWVPTLLADLRQAQERRDQPSTAALINYFNDEDMLRWQLEGGFLSHYSRIYIWDGPYRYLENLPLFRDSKQRLDERPLGKLLLADPRVVYHYAVWNDEYEKRVHAYDAIEEDVIFLHDTDEFPLLDRERLTSFWYGSKSIGCLQLENLYSGGLSGASTHYKGMAPDQLPRKWVVFKRREVSATEHINYLWLVGVDQHPMNQALLDHQPFCHAYHFTGCRNQPGQANKIAFYIALALRRGKSDPALERLRALVEERALSLDQARQIFLGGNVGFVGIPHPDTGLWLKRRLPNPSFSDVLMQRILAEQSVHSDGSYLLLDRYPLCLWFPHCGARQSLDLELQYPSRIEVQCWRWINCEKPDLIDTFRATGVLFKLDHLFGPESGPGDVDIIGHLLILQAVADDSAHLWQQLTVR